MAFKAAGCSTASTNGSVARNSMGEADIRNCTDSPNHAAGSLAASLALCTSDPRGGTHHLHETTVPSSFGELQSQPNTDSRRQACFSVQPVAQEEEEEEEEEACVCPAQRADELRQGTNRSRSLSIDPQSLLPEDEPSGHHFMEKVSDIPTEETGSPFPAGIPSQAAHWEGDAYTAVDGASVGTCGEPHLRAGRDMAVAELNRRFDLGADAAVVTQEFCRQTDLRSGHVAATDEACSHQERRSPVLTGTSGNDHVLQGGLSVAALLAEQALVKSKLEQEQAAQALRVRDVALQALRRRFAAGDPFFITVNMQIRFHSPQPPPPKEKGGKKGTPYITAPLLYTPCHHSLISCSHSLFPECSYLVSN